MPRKRGRSASQKTNRAPERGRRAPPTLEMASELLGRRHLAEVDPLQSREIGSSVAVRAKFESSSDQFRKSPCFVLFRGAPPAARSAGADRGWNPARAVSSARAVRAGESRLGDRAPASHLAAAAVPSLTAPRFEPPRRQNARRQEKGSGFAHDADRVARAPRFVRVGSARAPRFMHDRAERQFRFGVWRLIPSRRLPGGKRLP